MEKCILMLVLNLLFLFSVSAKKQETTTNEQTEKKLEQKDADQNSAQENQKISGNDDAKRKNFFLGVGVKGNIFMNGNTLHDSRVLGHPALGGNVFAGKWFNNYFGTRVVLEYGKLKPTFQKSTLIVVENYALSRLDLMLDLTSCFPTYTPNRIYYLMTYIGAGGAYAFNAKNRPDGTDHSSSIVFGGGFCNSFKLSDNLSVYLNTGLDLVDTGFEGYKEKKSFKGFASLSIGVIYNF